MSSAFTLHPQILKDSIGIGDLPLSHVRLMNDSTHPWLLLMPKRADVSEIIDLDDADRVQLMAEIAQVCQVLKALTGCDKLNVASLGNLVPQLHVHVIARFRGDAAWPKPVWGQLPAVAYSMDAATNLISQLRTKLSIS
ncbi:HIT family protein [Labrys okinawensis]|uniref:HIT family protein n=1 Tax=Labrys okinawensis TaxID=346911 RepID=UPI0039BC8121